MFCGASPVTSKMNPKMLKNKLASKEGGVLRLTISAFALGAALVSWSCFGAAVERRTVPLVAHEKPKPYVIGSDDELEIIVWTQTQLSGKVRVAPDGTITMPLVGRVQAAGETPDQLKDDLQERYSQYIHDANVTVRVSQPQSQMFYVTGEVNKPGAFQLHSGEVLSQAIAEAGGLGDYADPGKIRILRHGAAETEVLTVNYNRVISGGDVTADVPIEPGDTVTVP